MCAYIYIYTYIIHMYMGASRRRGPAGPGDTGIPNPTLYGGGVLLNILVKKGPLGIHFLKKGIPTKQGTYIMAISGISISSTAICVCTRTEVPQWDP